MTVKLFNIPYKLILQIFVLTTLINLVSINCASGFAASRNLQLNTTSQISDSIHLAFYKGNVYEVLVVGTHKKRIIAQLLNNEEAKKEIKIQKKHIFNILEHNNSLIPNEVKFIYYDSAMADDVVLKGKVLGFNTHYYLIEFRQNGQTKQTVKHKSEIVQKYLKK